MEPIGKVVSGMTAPDGCPVHFLDSDRTVVLDGLPYTAGLVCLTWHQIAPLREAFTRVLAEMNERALASVEPAGRER